MKFRKILFVVICCLIIVMFAGCPLLEIDEVPTGTTPPYISALDGQLEVHFIDVGQGDATLILTPCDRVIKVDGGDNHMRQDVIDYLNDLKIEHIDVVVATHPHADHIGGLIGVINEFSIGVIYKPEVPVDLHPDTQTLRRFNLAITDNEVETRYAVAGYVMWDYADLEIKVLSPSGGEYSRLNKYSLILSITYGDTRAILTGDAYKYNEQWVLEQDFDVNATLLSLGHHGSDTSSYLGFLQAVNPFFVIVSAGRNNRHGHPHNAVVDRVSQIETAIMLRTYEVGTIIAISNGVDVEIILENMQ